jgi:type VI protein secretion system component VasK
MNSDKVLIVVLLVIGIVVFANLAMFAWARSMRGLKFDWFKNMRGSINQPFKSEEDSLDELRQRVGELQKSDKKDEE